MGKQDPSTNKQPNTTFHKQESTITLKVLIHCEGCKRKVKRIIKCVDGVDSVNIEAEYGKVTVVGSGVDVKEVLNSLHKAGKHAEIWQFGGGGKALSVPNQRANPANTNNNNNINNNNNGEKNKMKAVGFEKLQENNNIKNNPKGKGNGNAMHEGNMSANMGGNKAKGGEMIELANAGPSLLMAPPKPPFPMGGFTPSAHFDKPNFSTNNVAILSRSVAPRPSIFHAETSLSPLDNSEVATAEYATHMFSDENANSCNVM